MTKLRAFVIMPFDQEFDAVYTDLIAKPLTDAGFLVQRADDVDTRQNVLVDVVRGIADADLVVADLTAANPNVFYELGLAHAMGVPTVLIAHQESADDIPFDLRQYRTEFYDTHFQRAKNIVEVLERLARAHGRGEVPFGSPISDFLPGATRPTVRAQRSGAVGSSSDMSEGADVDMPDRGDGDKTNLDQDDTAEDDRGLIDFVEAIGEASAELVEVTETFNQATDTVGSEVSALAERMQALDPSTPATQSQVKRFLLQTATILDDYAEGLEIRQAQYEDAVDKVTSNGLGYLTLLSENPQQFQDELKSSLEASTGLRDSAAQANHGMSGLRESIATLPPMLKQTNRASKRSVRALDALLSQQGRVRSYAEQSIRLAETALGEIEPRDLASVDDDSAS